ncbi:125 kDa kinesin-related protein [Dorcoceras hygrometricum]|uniref:125 kDa kinesin-related protein n=1 Tax=Dorcoceras hygrometricum TaxID=472368 RepID=A0A2Z7DI24_9LAMI|nr:125 kDa kinesin-related protein [Dorcoceras hygrometricum]
MGPQPLWLRNHNSGLAHRIIVKRLATSSHDPLGITDSACKNQLVVVSVQYGPFNPYFPIRSTTIGKSRVAIDPIAMHLGDRLVTSIGYPRMSASGESSTTMHRLLHASGSHPIPTPYDPKPEPNPRRIQPSRHRRSIAGAAAATAKNSRRQLRNIAPSATQRRASASGCASQWRNRAQGSTQLSTMPPHQASHISASIDAAQQLARRRQQRRPSIGATIALDKASVRPTGTHRRAMCGLHLRAVKRARRHAALASLARPARKSHAFMHAIWRGAAARGGGRWPCLNFAMSEQRVAPSAVDIRFLIVDCVGGRPSAVARANVSWSFEFYNPALFPMMAACPRPQLIYFLVFLLISTVLSEFVRLNKKIPFLLGGLLAKSKKSVALVEKPTEPSPAQVKSKKRKTSSAPSLPVQRSKGRKYSTRSSSRLQSRFSNTDADPVDLISSSPPSDADDDNSEDDGTPCGSPTVDEFIDDYALQGQDIGMAPESTPPSIPLRLAMISAVSILKASPEFSAEHPLLDSIAIIFSDSDAAQTKLTSLMAKRDDFHNKRRRAEAMEQENLSVRDRIRNLTVDYDVCEDVVKRLQREISEQRSNMALILDEAETLKKTLLSNRSATKAVVDEFTGLKGDYVDWTTEIRDSEAKQGECLLKWERLFC